MLFDLDGVLTPTADIHQLAWKDMFTQYFEAKGVAPYTDEDYFAYLDGRRRDEAIEAICASRGLTLPHGEATDSADKETIVGLGVRKNEDFLARLGEGIEAYPGSMALVELLHDAPGPRLAVVSSSRNAEAVLRAANMNQYFELVVDGNVAHDKGLPGKPAPDTYVYAAQQLEVAVEDAVVVEDAISGVQSGAAGAFGSVIGVDRGAGREALLKAGATHVVDDLAELISNPSEEPGK